MKIDEYSWMKVKYKKENGKMAKIEQYHWFVNDNSFSISLMRFYVKISKGKKENKGKILLTAWDSDLNKIEITFKTFEDAIVFTENEIIDCKSINEIIEKQNKRIEEERNKIKKLKRKNI